MKTIVNVERGTDKHHPIDPCQVKLRVNSATTRTMMLLLGDDDVSEHVNDTADDAIGYYILAHFSTFFWGGPFKTRLCIFFTLTQRKAKSTLPNLFSRAVV